MNKLRAAVAALILVAGVFVLAAPKADAWAWDPHVQVLGSVGKCGPSATAGWGWFQSSSGESGWMTWGPGSTFSFKLSKVPTSGANLTIKWGVSLCSAVAYKVVHRPAYGTQASIGFLG
jgi:hypothetical protein